MNEASGTVKITRSGVYSISGVVSCDAFDAGKSGNVELFKNEDCIQVSACGDSNGYNAFIPLNCVEHLEKDDVLKVVCTCNVGNVSYLAIVRLGD